MRNSEGIALFVLEGGVGQFYSVLLLFNLLFLLLFKLFLVQIVKGVSSHFAFSVAWKGLTIQWARLLKGMHLASHFVVVLIIVDFPQLLLSLLVQSCLSVSSLPVFHHRCDLHGQWIELWLTSNLFDFLLYLLLFVLKDLHVLVF